MSPERGRLDEIDAVRCVAVLMVVITHFWISGLTRLRLLFPFWINMAVPMFMVMTGIVNARSFEKRGVSSLSDALTVRYLVGRLVSYLLPYLVVFPVTYVIEPSSFAQGVPLVWQFLRGGVGQGGYYLPVMLQSVFFVPMIYLILSREGERGLLTCLAIQLAFEVLHTAYGVSADTYRLLFFRYWTAVSFGVWIWVGRGRPSARRPALRAGLVLASLAYICVVSYGSWEPVVLVDWTVTAFPVVPWAALLTVAGVRAFRWLRARWIGRYVVALAARLGRASYTIFWLQLVVYLALSVMGTGQLSGMGKLPLLVTILVLCLVGGALLDVPLRGLSRAVSEGVLRLIGERCGNQ